MLLAAADKVEAYELLFGPDAADDTDPYVKWKWGTGATAPLDPAMPGLLLGMEIILGSTPHESLLGSIRQRFSDLECSYKACRGECCPR
jgi:hypothetical protein